MLFNVLGLGGVSCVLALSSYLAWSGRHPLCFGWYVTVEMNPFYFTDTNAVP
jgi:hypothetical protein